MPGIELVNSLHRNLVFNRRSRVLADQLASLLPPDASILDIGCGDGTIDREILNKRPDLSIVGLDVFVRPAAQISVTVFDGAHVPYRDASFDVAMFIDVLHHTEQPEVVLREAQRVARNSIVIKDHFRNGFLADATLRVMDWVGNAGHGVALPYHYWSEDEWDAAFRSLQLEPDRTISRLKLYPLPASLIFDRGLHFIVRLPIAPSSEAKSY